VEEGGYGRRRWMDWAVFHVEPTFVDTWSRYQKALRQRNSALRAAPEQASAWDPELIRWGESLAESRCTVIERLQPFWRETVRNLTGLEIELLYSRGWSREASLAEALRQGRLRDEARGMTHSGPHRADIHLRLDGAPVREVASRGQHKLVAAALVLAQLRMLREAFTTTPTLLLDDPAAELDRDRLALFIEEVLRLKTQLVITSLSPDTDLFGAPDRVFHVEQGRVGPV